MNQIRIHFIIAIYYLQFTLISMNKLYSIAFKRILASLGAQEITPANVENILNDNKIKPLGSFIYHQFPKTQFREFLKVPCPVQNVDTEQSKQIIKSSKSLRASFKIEEQKACEKCPLRQKCPEYLKPGKQNEVNSVFDVLLFMSAMNTKSTMNDESLGFRVWSSGYKSSANIQAMLEDMKKGGSNIMQYERIRLELVANKLKQDQLAGSIKNLDTLNFQEKLKTTRKQRKQRKQKPQNQQQSQNVVRKTRVREQQIGSKDYKLFQEDQKIQFKQNNQERRRDRGDRRQERSNRMQIQNEPPRNTYRRQRQRQPRSSERYNNRQSYGQRRQNRFEDRGNRRNDYNRKTYNQNKNNYYEGERKQNNFDMRKLKGELRPDNQKQYRSQFKQRERSEYRSDEYRKDRNRQDRPRYADNQQQRRPRSRDGGASRNYQSQSDNYGTNMDRKFQKAGDVYKNPKIFESWDSGNQTMENKSFNKQEFAANTKRENININPENREKKERKGPTENKQPPQEQQRIGRKVRK